LFFCQGDLSDVVKSQFFLAQYKISVTESNSMALFEFEAFLNLALESKQREIDEIEDETRSLQSQMSHLGK
jgi:hypothetical protein